MDPARGPQALATTIVTNLLRDHLRTEKRFLWHRDVPGAAVRDIADEVVARDEWTRVAAALERLRPEERNLLVAAIHNNGHIEGRTPAAIRMMKMRARRHLRALAHDVRNAAAGCGLLLHRAWEFVRLRRLRSPSIVGEHAVQTASALLALATAGLVSGAAVPLPSTPRDSLPATQGTAEVGAPTPSQEAQHMYEALRYRPAGRDDPIRGEHRARRARGRTLLHAGPVRYQTGESATSGTLIVEHIPLGLRKPEADVGHVRKLCSVGVLGSCKQWRN